MRFDRLIGDIVRRNGFRLRAERSRLASRSINEQIAIAHSRMVLPSGAAALVFLQQLNQLAGQIARNLARREASHAAIGHMHEIATNGPIERPQFDALGGRFDRRPASMEFERVIAEQAHCADIAAGRHRGGNMVRLPDHPFADQRVHVRSPRGF
jgi:hypothetical protein